MTTAQPAETARLTAGRATFSPAAAYALFAAAVCLLLYDTLGGMVGMWLSSSSHHHSFLVAPIALWMIAGAKPVGAPPRVWPPAAAGVAGAGLVWLAGRAAGVNLVEQIAFVSLLIAGAALIFGDARARAWSFALLFLFFMVPFGETLTPVLRALAAHGCVLMLNLTGIHASLDGTLITSAGGRFEVADACAGLNFLLAALMVAAIFSWRSLPGWRRKAVFLAVAAVMAVLANIVRAYGVVALANVAGGRFSIASDHIMLGWAFYGALLFALVAIGRRMAGEARPVPPEAMPAANHPAPRGLAAALVLSAVFLAAVTAYGHFIIARAPESVGTRGPLPLMNVSGWRPLAADAGWRPNFTHADREMIAAYAAGGDVVQIAAGYFAYDRPGAEIAGYNTRADTAFGWRRVGAGEQRLAAFGHVVDVSIETIENDAAAQLDAVTVYWLGDTLYTNARALKVAQTFQRLRGISRNGGALIIAAPHVENPRALKRFLAEAEPLHAWLARIDAG